MCPRPPFARTVAGGEQYYCTDCAAYLPTGAFYTSTAKTRRRVCKAHWDRRQRRRLQKPAGYAPVEKDW